MQNKQFFENIRRYIVISTIKRRDTQLAKQYCLSSPTQTIQCIECLTNLNSLKLA